MRSRFFSYPLLRSVSNALFSLLVLNTVVISIFVYGIFSRQMTEDVYSVLVDDAHLASSVTEAFYSEVSRLSANLATNETAVTDAIFQKQSTLLDYYAMIRLKNVSLSYPYLAYSAIYRQKEDRLTATIDIGRPSADEIKGKLREEYDTGRTTTFFAIEVKPNEKNASLSARRTITFAAYSGLSRREEIGAVILGVETAHFEELYANIDSAKYAPFILMDKDGNALSAGNDSKALADWKTAGIPSKILETKGESGYFNEKIGQRQVVVSYSKNLGIGGLVFQVADYDNVFQNLAQMQLKLMLISLAVLCAGTAASYFLAYKLLSPLYHLLQKYSYRPSRQNHKSEVAFLDSEFVRLSAGAAKSRDLMRHMALYDLLLNQNISDNATTDILRELSRFPFYAVVLLSIDRQAADKSVAVQEASVIRYALCNIAAEILAETCLRLDMVIMNSADVAVILSLTDGQIPKQLGAALSENTRAMETFYHTRVLAAVSSVASSIYDLNDAYEETVALREKNFLYGRAVLYAGEALPLPQNKPFPLATVRALQEAVSKADAQAADKQLDKFFSYISTADYECAISYTTRLITDLAHSNMEAAPKAGAVSLQSILPEIHKARTIVQAEKRVRMLCHAMIEICAPKPAGYSPAVKQALALTEKNCTDEAFSINTVANALGLTSAYFNRIFKKELGASFGEHLNMVRLRYARGLLGETALSVAEVSARSGFANLPYFYTLFKRVYGITPAEYRLTQKETAHAAK